MIEFRKSTLGIARFAVWYVGLLPLATYHLPTAAAAPL